MKFIFIIFILMLMTGCDNYKKTNTYNKFIYYDLDGRETFIIDYVEKSIAAYGQVIGLEICKNNDKNICFNSKYFSFGIPKKLGYSQTWNIGEVKYCLIERSYDKTNDSLSLIVNFGYAKTCEEIKENSSRLIFNTKFGLRYIEGMNLRGIPVKFIALKEYGFGGNFIVKIRNVKG